MNKLKKLFNNLQLDSKSTLFVQDQLNDKLLKKLKKSKYIKDQEFVNSFNLLVDNKANFNKKMMVDIQFHLKLNTFKKAMILIALLYIAYKHPLIFCTLMLVIYALPENLQPILKYCLLLVDLFTSKDYVYGTKNRSLIPLKLEKFYKEVANKHKNKKMRLQTDLEFKQKIVFALNKKYNVDVFDCCQR